MEQNDQIQFICPLANTVPQEVYKPLLQSSNKKICIAECDTCSTYNIVGHSDLAIVASGTATLETAILETPEIIFYKTSPATYFIGRYLLGLKTVGLPNILAQQMIVPEMLGKNLSPKKLAQQVFNILKNPDRIQKIKTSLADIKPKLGSYEAYSTTAKFIDGILKS